MNIYEKIRDREVRAGVTIFFSLIFTIIVTLICTIIESARIYSSGVCAKSAAYTALESEFAGYARQMFEDYGILGVWPQNGLKEEIQQYIDANNNQVNMQEENNGFNLINPGVCDISLSRVKYITDDGGDVFIKQILKYEKYEMAENLTEKILSNYKTYNEGENKNNRVNTENISDDYEKILEDSEILNEHKNKLQKNINSICDNKIWDEYEKMKDTISDTVGKLEDKDVKGNKKQKLKLIKYFNNLDDMLKNLEEDIKKEQESYSRYNSEKQNLLSKYAKELSKDKENNFQDRLDKSNASVESMSKHVVNVIQIIAKREDEIPENKKEGLKTLYDAYFAQIKKEMQDMAEEREKAILKDENQDDGGNKSILESAKKILKMSIMELVVPDNMNISHCAINNNNLPSVINKADKGKELSSPVNKAMYVQYLNNNFKCVTDRPGDTTLKYEKEYIISGKSSDKDNLSDIITKLIVIRQALNSAYMASDSKKMAECASVASGIATSIGMPFLEPVIKILIMQAWVFLESVADVKDLLGGKAVVLIKSEKDWKTSIADFGKVISNDSLDENKDSSNNKRGLKYNDYIQILLMTLSTDKLAYRTMDLINLNMKNRYNPEFDINRCVVEAEINVTYKNKFIFVTLPFVSNILGNDAFNIQMKTNAYYGYT